MPVDITLDAYPHLNFSGKVTSISAVDKVDYQRMRPGLSARVVIRGENSPNRLIAPRAALDLSGKEAKARLATGKTVPVKLGTCNAQDCVVTGGLEEGQRLARIDEAING